MSSTMKLARLASLILALVAGVVLVACSSGTTSGPGTTAPARYTVGADGVAEVQLAIRNTKYVPNEIVIPADRPVRIIIDRQESVPCSDQFQIQAAEVFVDLAPNGVTRVDVPPMSAGTYAMTCGMEMMSGKIIVVEGGSQ